MYGEAIVIGLVIWLIIAAGLGFIPASIAKRKGYSFGLWWLCGWLLFIVAIIHVNLMPDKNAQTKSNTQSSSMSNSEPTASGQNVADELRRYKELLDQGVISEEEFQSIKEHFSK